MLRCAMLRSLLMLSASLCSRAASRSDLLCWDCTGSCCEGVSRSTNQHPFAAGGNLPLPLPSPQVRIHSAKGDEGLFDFLVISTGFLTHHSVSRLVGTACTQVSVLHCWGSLCRLSI